jgi:hypothetical protein
MIALGGAERLLISSAALRRLASTDLQLMQARKHAELARRELVEAKGRLKALSKMAKQYQQALDRKEGEEQMLETALVMWTKVSGKHDVMS